MMTGVTLQTGLYPQRGGHLIALIVCLDQFVVRQR